MDPERTSGRAGGSVSWRGVAWITGGALALYLGFRALPTGTNLHHMDFQVSGANALEMCDPANPQFIPVVAMRSPVRATLRTADGIEPEAARESLFVLTLETSGGKPIGREDLLTVHTRRLHLLVVDETLGDYQHLHPEPGERPGEWRFAHRPARGGVYRVFADFTPAATGRGLYSFADYRASVAVRPDATSAVDASGGWAGSAGAFRGLEPGTEHARGEWRLRLEVEKGGGLRSGEPNGLVFGLRAEDGRAVPLQPVMGAWVHATAFDRERSGFAHLHPRAEPGTGEPPRDGLTTPPPVREPTQPRFVFDVMIPRGGDYTVWVQFQLGEEECFVPFALPVGGG